MRGEELQLLGAVSRYGDGVFVIPGTHSKWALVNNKTIERFRTVPTGELFDVLVKHSLIGALTSNQKWSDSFFEQGVKQGYESETAVTDMFSARSSVLLAQRTGEQSYAWLSGLLIGNEIRETKTVMPCDRRQLTLIGSMQLCEKYLVAFACLGIKAAIAEQDVAVLGYQHLIQN